MDIIKKYIYAIQRRLLSKNQEDIAKEINSLIFDELEDKYGKKDEYTNEEIEAVLKAMGPPREVASRYRGDKQLLIGEELFPIFKMVLAISLGATTMGLVVSFIVKIILNSDLLSARYFLGNIAQLIGSIVTVGISMVGSITIIFALIQYFGKFESGKMDIYQDWTPKDLPELPEEKDRVPVWEPVIAMFFITIGFLIVNLFVARGTVPYFIGQGSELKVLYIFNVDVVRKLLPLWNLSFVLSFILEIIMLIKRKKTLGSRLFELGTSLLGIVILVIMLNSQMIFSMTEIISKYGAQSWIDTMQQYYYIMIKVVMGFSILGIVISTIKIIVKQAQKANV